MACCQVGKSSENVPDSLNKPVFNNLGLLHVFPKYALAVDNPFWDHISSSFAIQFCLLVIVLLTISILAIPAAGDPKHHD